MPQLAELHDIWVYLAASPLLHLTLTLVAFQAGTWIYRRTGNNPLANPVLIAVVALVALLVATDTDYASYFAGAQFVHFLIGPATVALAIPLYRQFAHVRRSGIAILAFAALAFLIIRAVINAQRAAAYRKELANA